MAGKILSFKTPEKCFLQNIQELFERLQEKNLNKVEKQEILQKIKILVNVYEEKMPNYFNSIFYHMHEIVEKELDWDTEEIAIEEVLLFCNLLSQQPSPNVFKQLVAACFFELPSCTQFNEKVLSEIVEELMEDQEKAEVVKETTDLNSLTFFRDLTHAGYANWIALVRMQTATEKILLKAIEIAKLDLGNFYEFCQEIIVSKQSTEIVLLALLQRINNTSWKENNRMYDLLQMNLYWFLLKNGKVTEKIVSQVLEIAKPRGSMYYQFYHMVIQKFGKKQKTARQLSKILERDEIRLGKKYHASRKKLTLLLENQI